MPLIGGPRFLPVHVAVVVDENHVFDFVPESPRDPQTIQRLVSLQGVKGNMRAKVTGPSTAASRVASAFFDTYNGDELHLLKNNCWTFALSLVWHLRTANLSEEGNESLHIDAAICKNEDNGGVVEQHLDNNNNDHDDSDDIGNSEHGSKFRFRLPPSRLGQAHPSFASFEDAVRSHHTVTSTKEFSMVVVTEPAPIRRILLGEKQRGFGKGFHGSFGGKVEPGESGLDTAVRELEEETGIAAPPTSLRSIGDIRFTFQDTEEEMLVHVYRLNVRLRSSDTESISTGDRSLLTIGTSDIRPCDEIVPEWFDDWYGIPLDNMFADDSLWLTELLESDENDKMEIDGWFHFQEGGAQEVNTILHCCMDKRQSGSSGA